MLCANVHAVGAEVGLSVSEDAADAVAKEAHHRSAELVELGLKLMHHGKRKRLSLGDMNKATRVLATPQTGPGKRRGTLFSASALYGYSAPSSSETYARSGGVVFHMDRDESLRNVVNAVLPACPLQSSLAVHWLAVAGVTPAISQNVGPTALKGAAAPGASSLSTAADGSALALSGLTNELQLYFDRITTIVKSGSAAPVLLRGAYKSLSHDPGLSPLVPFFCQFIATEVTLRQCVCHARARVISRRWVYWCAFVCMYAAWGGETLLGVTLS